MNACGDSRLRGLRSRKPIGFRQWVVHSMDLNDAENLYFLDVQTKVNAKLAEIQ